MASVEALPELDEIEYPTCDGKPMAETDWHAENLTRTKGALRRHYAHDSMIYVGGNLIMCYVKGDKRKHISPDVFVVFGVPNHFRLNYLVWQEGRAPDVAFEFTSKSSKREDIKDKFHLYQDVLKVKEYFLFDPLDEYLDPPLQGYLLHEGEYIRIEPIDGRLPSEVLGLHLERDGTLLRLYDPAMGEYVLSAEEAADQAEAQLLQQQQAMQAAEADARMEQGARRMLEAKLKTEEVEKRAAEAKAKLEQRAKDAAEAKATLAQQARAAGDAARILAESEVERMRRELDELRRRLESGT